MNPRRALWLAAFLRPGRRYVRVRTLDRIVNIVFAVALAVGAAWLLADELSDCSRAAAWCAEDAK